MNTTDYQLETLRARFAARGYQPLNARRIHPSRCVLIGMLIGLAILAARSI